MEALQPFICPANLGFRPLYAQTFLYVWVSRASLLWMSWSVALTKMYYWPWCQQMPYTTDPVVAFGSTTQVQTCNLWLLSLSVLQEPIVTFPLCSASCDHNRQYQFVPYETLKPGSTLNYSGTFLIYCMSFWSSKNFMKTVFLSDFAADSFLLLRVWVFLFSFQLIIF